MKVFIDGQAGTTGLQLEERLSKRNDIELLAVEPALRKDADTRLALMAQADCIFLCLPDDEARLAAAMAPADTVVIDASTAHRTTPDWVYGLPELSTEHQQAIKEANRISNPGCHAAGFIALVYPLISCGLLPRDAKLACTSITGYSGGGKGLIETYETGRTTGDTLQAPRPYALGLSHKHLPEMQLHTGLSNPPLFMPVLGDMKQGMLVNVPIWDIDKNILWKALCTHYKDSLFITVMPLLGPNEPLDPTACNGTNHMELFVAGNNKQALLIARFDNLGKGASGAAVQNMNIRFGFDEKEGL
jgi:N-acetyl-gamma-glutamyl-phosphate reductase